jgi:hypothetical protein
MYRVSDASIFGQAGKDNAPPPSCLLAAINAARFVIPGVSTIIEEAGLLSE